MLKLITGEVEVLSKDHDTQSYPICDESGFTIGSAETYQHAMEIKKAVTSHNKILNLLKEAKEFLLSGDERAMNIQKRIERMLVS